MLKIYKSLTNFKCGVTFLWSFWIVLLTIIVDAEENLEESPSSSLESQVHFRGEEPSYAYIAVVAVSPKPPRRFAPIPQTSLSIEPGSMKMLAPDLEEIPPRLIWIRPSGVLVGGVKDRSYRLPLVRNSPTIEWIPVPAQKSLVIEKPRGINTQHRTSWFSVGALKPESRVLILVLPTGEGRELWKGAVKSIKVNLSESEKEHRLVSVNTLNQTVQQILETKEHILKPNSIAYISVRQEAGVQSLSATYGKDKKPLIRFAQRFPASKHTQCIIYYNTPLSLRPLTGKVLIKE